MHMIYLYCSTSIVRRNMRRLDAECRRCEAREISKESDRLGVPPWWCDRTRYPDEPARIAREIMQGAIHLKPLQHDPSPGLGGTYGPFSLAQTTKDARRVDPLRSHQESDSLGVPPWWCDRARYPDEPARIAREILQGAIHLKPLQHDPSRGLGGPCGPYCR